MDLSEGVQSVAPSRFFQLETAFVRPGIKSPGDILPQDGELQEYVRRIALLMFKLGQGKSTNC